MRCLLATEDMPGSRNHEEQDKRGPPKQGPRGELFFASDGEVFDAGRRPSLFESVTPVLSVMTMAIGVLVMLGWISDNEMLKAFVPRFSPMKFNAALTAAVAATGLLSTTRAHGVSPSQARRIAFACAGFAVLMGLLTLFETFTGVDLGIDQAIIHESNVLPGLHPGRMAWTTSISFVIFGAVLHLLTRDAEAYAMAIQAGAVIIILIAVTTVLGYVYDTERLYRERLTYTPMAINAATAFTFLGTAVLCARRDYLVRRIISDSGPAGSTARQLVPVAILLPLLGGMLTAMADHLGVTGHTFDIALFAAVMMACFTGMVVWNADSLYRIEALRKKAETARSHLAAIVESSGDGIISIELDGTIRSWNAAAEKIYGFSATEIMGSSVFVLAPSGHAGEMEALIERVRHGVTVEDHETVRTRKDGIQIHVSMTLSPIRDETDNVTGISIVVRDITQKVHAEQELKRYRDHLEEEVDARTAQLRAAYHEMEMFSYSVSHDLRIPLRAMDGYSRMLLEDYNDRLDDEGRRMLNVVRSNSQRMARLIDDILDFIRLGRQNMKIGMVDMGWLAQSVADELKPLTAGRNVSVNLLPMPAAEGDHRMLRQVFYQLLNNAIKFTRPKPDAVIELSGHVEGGEHIYRIRDNGVGFDMKYSNKLFGMFHRLHGIEEFEGNGTGLAVAKRIVNRHGGRIWAEAEVGKGATFNFSLPADRSDMRYADEAGFLASSFVPEEGSAAIAKDSHDNP